MTVQEVALHCAQRLCTQCASSLSRSGVANSAAKNRRLARKAQAVLAPDTQDEYYSLEIVADTLRGCLGLNEATLPQHGYSLPYFKS